ncbi:hypothetical protein SAMN05444422_11451 [Halobiforma haloterrestris]|uniref:Uncharacterized protein n=1 Tax=Natronobacterium haloterrestre TaxID=148448 RepID=A0A1I1L419_NATHA|nr:hypothetical protein SAMN05444422_11451 [Halobiforma haloterrestris]
MASCNTLLPQRPDIILSTVLLDSCLERLVDQVRGLRWILVPERRINRHTQLLTDVSPLLFLLLRIDLSDRSRFVEDLNVFAVALLNTFHHRLDAPGHRAQRIDFLDHDYCLIFVLVFILFVFFVGVFLFFRILFNVVRLVKIVLFFRVFLCLRLIDVVFRLRFRLFEIWFFYLR